MLRNTLITILLVAILGLTATPGWAGAWFRAAGGLSDMAMDDISQATFDFYDDPTSESRFDDVGTGFVLDLGVGSDLSPTWGMGFHWDRQWAGTSATSYDVTGDLNLNAHFFMARGYWHPWRPGSFNLGLVAGSGYFFTDGSTDVRRGTVNYGQLQLWGHGWAWDAAGQAEFRLRKKTMLQLQVGWRWAVIDQFEVDKRPVFKDDGTRASLDYSGWQVKVGVRWILGDEDHEGAKVR